MNYQKFSENDIANGPGVRVTLWVSGCNHQCSGCHNPQTWSPSSGIPFDEKAVSKLYQLLSRNYIRGLTISGGDPLYPANRETLTKLVASIRNSELANKDIWVWTGYLWEEVKDLPIIKYIDVLVDGPFVQDLKDITLFYSGSSNQRVIDVQKSLNSKKLILIKNKR